jgi:hypothetical protein
MKSRNTVAGLVVLGVVLTGAFLARSPGHRGPGPSTDATGPGPGPRTTDASLPDVTFTDAALDLGDVRVTLSVTPRPPVAFQKKRFRVRVESHGTPVTVEGGRISLEMRMPMGDHRYALVPGGDGWHGAEVVLPFCRSGDPRWYALVEGTVGGRPFAARFRVDLTRPGAAPAP